MGYTLGTWALWLVAAALIGGIVGWVLRGVQSSPSAGADAAAGERERLHAEVAELRLVAADRDRVQAELEAVRAATEAVDADLLATVTGERNELVELVANQESSIGELRVRLWNAEARARDLQAVLDAVAVEGMPPEPDLAAGSLILGVPVAYNDLTLIEGVGPKIAQLCIARGLSTWWSVANADLELLRSMLADGGPKFQVHDPTSWPQQARLLANGQWEKFKTLADALRGGSNDE